MTIYQLALKSGITVQWSIQDGAFVVAVSLRDSDAVCTGRGATLDAAMIDALTAMDGASFYKEV